MQRRDFLRQVGSGVLGGALAPAVLSAETSSPATRPAVGSIKDLPTRRLGRIGIQVPLLSFGTAAMGHAFFTREPFEEVTNAVLDAGVKYVDTAPIYDVAEERLGPVMARRRKEVFLVCKSHKPTSDAVLGDIENTLRKTQTDHVDLCHVHNCGEFTYEEVAGKGGMLDGLREAKKRGWIKHIGISGHQRAQRFIPVIETGEIDLIMVAMNYVHRHIYNFEETVLPVARKHDCAIVCMKVMGGAQGKAFEGYKKRAPGRLSSDELRQDAFDYALSIPGVATLVVGMKSLEEVRLAIQAVRNHRPLEGERRERVLAKGAELAKEWKDHFGPVA